MAPAGASPDIADRLRRGGLALAIRQALGAASGLAGLAGLGRLLGPAEYGCFAAALALVTAVVSIGGWGVLAWIVRLPTDPCQRTMAAATSVLALTGSVTGLAGAGVSSLLFRDGLAAAAAPALAMVATAVVCLPALVPLALIERKMRYDRIAMVELLGQVAFVLLALAAARLQPTALAVACAWCLQQFAMAIAWHVLAGHRPILGGVSSAAGEACSYGWRFTAASAAWHLRNLVTPVALGLLCGAWATGLVSMAGRLIETASIARSALWRMSMPALAKLRDRPAALADLESSATLAVVVVMGVIMAVVATGAVLLPWILGSDWRGVSLAAPVLAVASLASSLYVMRISTLHLDNRSLVVAAFHILQTAGLALGAVLLIPALGWYGLLVSELLVLPAWLLIGVWHRRVRGAGRFAEAALAAAAFAIAACTPIVGWHALAAPLLWLCRPASRSGLAEAVATLRGSARPT
jgi:O-antigen/teichoic acid export membrane protein